jgi:hypothetical protein
MLGRWAALLCSATWCSITSNNFAVPTKGILYSGRNKPIFSTVLTQSNPDFTSAFCSRTLCFAKHYVFLAQRCRHKPIYSYKVLMKLTHSYCTVKPRPLGHGTAMIIRAVQFWLGAIHNAEIIDENFSHSIAPSRLSAMLHSTESWVILLHTRVGRNWN